MAVLDRLAGASRAASATQRHDADLCSNARDLPAFLDITNPPIPFGIYVQARDPPTFSQTETWISFSSGSSSLLEIEKDIVVESL